MHDSVVVDVEPTLDVTIKPRQLGQHSQGPSRSAKSPNRRALRTALRKAGIIKGARRQGGGLR